MIISSRLYILDLWIKKKYIMINTLCIHHKFIWSRSILLGKSPLNCNLSIANTQITNLCLFWRMIKNRKCPVVYIYWSFYNKMHIYIDKYIHHDYIELFTPIPHGQHGVQDKKSLHVFVHLPVPVEFI